MLESIAHLIRHAVASASTTPNSVSSHSLLLNVSAGLLIIVLPIGARAVYKLFSGQKAMMVVLTGRPVTDLEAGTKGLVATVAEHTEALSALTRGVAAILADTKPNNGTTGKDALNRIEGAIKAQDEREHNSGD